MKILALVQGSDEWVQSRLKYLCASEAPVMMSCSKFMSRKQLLGLKKGWQKNPVGSFKQKLFDNGHENEDNARENLEFDLCEYLPPVVGVTEVEGLELLSSFDGFGEHCYIWEHKSWNEVLAENVRNGVLEPLYYWQLEHQMLTAGVDEAHFMVSDGTIARREMMTYVSVPKRRTDLIAGWKQFVVDLADYVPEAKQEEVVGQTAESFPVIKYEVAGSLVSSNITQILPLIKARAEQEMNRVLDTDQDFADKEIFNKEVKKTRANLKEVRANMTNEFVSLSEVTTILAETDTVLQKLQAHGEKQVKRAKEKKKDDIEIEGANNLLSYIRECNQKIKPLLLTAIGINADPDFYQAMKGKRTIESLHNAVDGVLVKAKIEIDQAMSRIVPNQIYLQEHATEYAFLFSDVQQIINHDIEPFQAIVKSRIADHKKAEEEKAEALREKIRIEEELKAENKIKGDNLIKSWEEAAYKCGEFTDIDYVTGQYDFLRESICDIAIFGGRQKEALDVLIYCRKEAEDRIRDLRHAERIADDPEEAEVVEPEVPAEESLKLAEEIIDDIGTKPGSVSAEYKPTFAEEMAAWAEEYGVSFEATTALSKILERHAV